jgi:hypothetical protein
VVNLNHVQWNATIIFQALLHNDPGLLLPAAGRETRIALQQV